jgi:hypothetical protein
MRYILPTTGVQPKSFGTTPSVSIFVSRNWLLHNKTKVGFILRDIREIIDNPHITHDQRHTNQQSTTRLLRDLGERTKLTLNLATKSKMDAPKRTVTLTPELAA